MLLVGGAIYGIIYTLITAESYAWLKTLSNLGPEGQEELSTKLWGDFCKFCGANTFAYDGIKNKTHY